MRRDLQQAYRIARRLVMLLLALGVMALGVTPAHAEAAPPSAPIVLPELPEVPKSSFDKPTPEAMNELKEHLERVRSADPVVRERAVREVLEAKPGWVSAIYHHTNALADNADRDRMKEKLRKIRDRARDAVREEMRRKGEKGEVVTPDYLQMVAEYAEPKDESWQALITVLAMSRMLGAIGSVEAARALIQVYVRFGEFLRVDTQLGLQAMGEKAAAALIEARKHPAEKIARWAARQLDQMGKAIPSELVQTEDQQVLADVLRAYGRIQDPDAARIIISFANSERAQIRLAARQGVRLMGEAGHWQLRDTYQNIVGKNPPRDWSWKRTARELFHEFDRLRLAQVHKHFDEGLEAQKKGDWEAMRKAFDSVLAQNPMFDRRDEMVAGYLEYAKALPEDRIDDAIVALRRAERINADLNRQPSIESLRLTLEGERLLKRGIADQTRFRRALELDSQNQRARDGIVAIERGERLTKPEFSRYYGAMAIGGVALIAIALIVFWRPRRGPQSEARPETEPQHHNQPQPETQPEPQPLAEVADADAKGDSEGAADVDTEGDKEASEDVDAKGDNETTAGVDAKNDNDAAAVADAKDDNEGSPDADPTRDEPHAASELSKQE